ncbi:MAG: peptidylprolyl isomerase [Casimicrobiaceae bacterium]
MLKSLALHIIVVGTSLLVGGDLVQAQTQASTAPPTIGGATQASDPGVELLHSGDIRLTRGEYDTQLSRLPEEARGGFGTNVDRINALLRVMLVDKTLAKQARDEGIDRDPEVAGIISAETDRILAQAVMTRNEKQWDKDFNARPNIEAAAHERWLTQPDKFRKPAEIKVTHLLFSTAKRSALDARVMAQAARAKIIEGANMDALVKSESEDPAAAQDGGHIGWSTAQDLDPRFARGAFALAKVGDVSRPIETDKGFELIRLDAKRPGTVRPYEEVKAAILAELRKEYVDTLRAQRMAAIRNDPAIVVNQPAVDALVVRIDPEILKKAGGESNVAPATPGRTPRPVAH